MLKISNLPVLLVLLLIAACQGQDADTDTAPAAEVSQSETTETAEMVEMVGYFTAQRGGFAALELDQEAIATIADGVQKGFDRN